ncbi:MAG: Fis family transcriptional regulator [Gammaproteobacteria bacterium]|jgi:Fis family transcriptional regulator|nr:Fis family transcriptional regulator [Gammaproteobacteria bacterium]MBT3490255.1 Fis family transcriptional regulator [Gammaproteobacteria bacterium]MBT3719848.1 Fis family transcriptional regulator [Gammaproteobacteria bacterium]MBT3845696.1 Fis family transcriptional regulator [Gammaproteobacteria bacterium]MBT3893135.1 Fis family transcriptional regulator [Gammaproteobacteria bacterium]
MSEQGDKRCNSMRDCIRSNLQEFFEHLEDAKTYDLYQRILHEVEQPMLELSLQRCGWNQSRTAKMLGINRNTLKKKIDQYNIQPTPQQPSE